MNDHRVSYYIDRYGVFHKILPESKRFFGEGPLKPTSTWLRLICLFWNPRILKTAFRFVSAAVIMNHFERVGFALLLLCFTL